jgi:exosortase
MKNTTKELRNLKLGDYAILFSLIVTFSSTIYKLATMGWKDADYTHAYFILPISLWLIWKMREALIKTELTSKAGLALFAAALFMYLFAKFNDFMFLDAISFVVMMWAIFRVRFTQASVRKIIFPLAYLLFMVPPPALAIDMMTLPLRKISTYGSYLLLKLAHLPVAVHGAILKVGEHELFIADACSGFRSIVTLLALGAIYAYSQDTSLKKKWIIFLSVLPLGIMGNIFRITLTGTISHFIGAKFAEGFFHSFSGAVLFVFTVLGLIGVTNLIVKKNA